MNTLYTCSRCNGSGHVPLNGVYLETLMAISDLAVVEVTGAEMARLDGCRETAMNNRLAALERFGFLVSRRVGTRRYYRMKT